jgi:hypothetical protein
LAAATAAETPAKPTAEQLPAAAGDVTALSAAELAALDPDKLTDNQLEQVFRIAAKLDAGEIAGRFARTLTGRPAGGDRWPVYQHLIQEAQSAGDFDAALGLVDEGEQADCEANQGRRRNDYELRRGRLLAKAGHAEQARDTFQRLVDRVPDDVQVAGSAAESMLGAKRPADALRFAEHGLSRARAQNNRDSEGYFVELVEAAKKQRT